MRKYLSIFLFLFLSSSPALLAQDTIMVIPVKKETVKPCRVLLEESNKKWKTDFAKTFTKKEQLNLIVRKAENDSVYQYTAPEKPLTTNKNNDDCGCKILLMLQYSATESVILDTNKNTKITHILKLLNERNIQTITAYLEDGFSAYGAKGICGAVLLSTDDKGLQKNIREILK
jgi:hypothetical protein